MWVVFWWAPAELAGFFFFNYYWALFLWFDSKRYLSPFRIQSKLMTLDTSCIYIFLTNNKYIACLNRLSHWTFQNDSKNALCWPCHCSPVVQDGLFYIYIRSLYRTAHLFYLGNSWAELKVTCFSKEVKIMVLKKKKKREEVNGEKSPSQPSNFFQNKGQQTYQVKKEFIWLYITDPI